MKKIVAFDIERAGPRRADATIAVGAVALDAGSGAVVDELFLPMYSPDQTTFDAQCWDSFWSKHTDVLEMLRGDADVEEFYKFLDKHADATIVTDNNVFDAGFMDTFGRTHRCALETFSQQRGILIHFDKYFVRKNDWGYADRVRELFVVPESMGAALAASRSAHREHNPLDDAAAIARDQFFIENVGAMKRRAELAVPHVAPDRTRTLAVSAEVDTFVKKDDKDNDEGSPPMVLHAVVVDERYARVAEFAGGADGFQAFRSAHADADLVVQSGDLDGARVSRALMAAGHLPLPFDVSGQYAPLWDVRSEVRGYLVANGKRRCSFDDLFAHVAAEFGSRVRLPSARTKWSAKGNVYRCAIAHQVLLNIRDGRA